MQRNIQHLKNKHENLIQVQVLGICMQLLCVTHFSTSTEISVFRYECQQADLYKSSSPYPFLPRTNTKTQGQPVTAQYLYKASTDRKLCFHQTLLVLSNSASSPFTIGHQLKPLSPPALQYVLLAETAHGYQQKYLQKARWNRRSCL